MVADFSPNFTLQRKYEINGAIWSPDTGNTKGGKYHCTVDLLFDWFEISCMTTDNFCFNLQNKLIQTSQTGGQLYSYTSPFSIPCLIVETGSQFTQITLSLETCSG